MSLGIDIEFLNGNFGPYVLIALETNKKFCNNLAPRLPNEFKTPVILTFHMGKLSPSNLGGQLIVVLAMCV